MSTSSTHYVASRIISFYEPVHEVNVWAEAYKSNGNSSIIVKNPQDSASVLIPMNPKLENRCEEASQNALEPSRYEQGADKIQRRLAQNREAARKSRLRKKAYVQQLETSRLKLLQLEQEFHNARQQGINVGATFEVKKEGIPAPSNTGISKFEREHSRWLEEQEKLMKDLKGCLNSCGSDAEVEALVESAIAHQFELYRLKSDAAKADILFIICGTWTSSVERIFLWLGGFRPSELLKVLRPQMGDLTEQQYKDMGNLSQSCQQAEEALSQGMEKLQQHMSEAILGGQLDGTSFYPQIQTAMAKFDGLVRFAHQADHLRQETLNQLSRSLSTRQLARALLFMGEYFHRLRALSSFWAARASATGIGT